MRGSGRLGWLGWSGWTCSAAKPWPLNFTSVAVKFYECVGRNSQSPRPSAEFHIKRGWGTPTEAGRKRQQFVSEMGRSGKQSQDSVDSVDEFCGFQTPRFSCHRSCLLRMWREWRLPGRAPAIGLSRAQTQGSRFGCCEHEQKASYFGRQVAG